MCDRSVGVFYNMVTALLGYADLLGEKNYSVLLEYFDFAMQNTQSSSPSASIFPKFYLFF